MTPRARCPAKNNILPKTHAYSHTKEKRHTSKFQCVVYLIKKSSQILSTVNSWLMIMSQNPSNKAHLLHTRTKNQAADSFVTYIPHCILINQIWNHLPSAIHWAIPCLEQASTHSVVSYGYKYIQPAVRRYAGFMHGRPDSRSLKLSNILKSAFSHCPPKQPALKSSQFVIGLPRSHTCPGLILMRGSIQIYY